MNEGENLFIITYSSRIHDPRCQKCGHNKTKMAWVDDAMVPTEHGIRIEDKIKHTCLQCGFFWYVDPLDKEKGVGDERFNQDTENWI